MALEDEIREKLAEIYSQQLEKNDRECPYDSCSATVFDVKIWVDKNDRFAGEAFCLSCNRLFELDLEDSQAQDALSDVEDALDDLRDVIDDF